MRPLRLTWTLSSPLVSAPYPLHLDALVAYAVTEEALRSAESGYASPEGHVRQLANDLPLARATNDQGSWCWKASALIGKAAMHSTRLWTRRIDCDDYARRIAEGLISGGWGKYISAGLPLPPYAYKIDLQRGAMKAGFQFFPVRHVHTVTAWCIGDEDRLRELLDPDAGLVTNIGARARTGFGKVLSLVIEEDTSAEELWQQRMLPWPEEGYVPLQAAHHPPYWAPENRFSESWAPALLIA